VESHPEALALTGVFNRQLGLSHGSVATALRVMLACR
jgi:hypothetical protein